MTTKKDIPIPFLLLPAMGRMLNFGIGCGVLCVANLLIKRLGRGNIIEKILQFLQTIVYHTKYFIDNMQQAVINLHILPLLSIWFLGKNNFDECCPAATALSRFVAVGR
ncbi:MAG: hypothetical protein IKD33_06640 [Bacteroidales bacterium]|nr:hypothetical protein [Bacteroidales bacterium]